MADSRSPIRACPPPHTPPRRFAPRRLLAPLALAYAGVIALRNRSFDRNPRRVQRAAAPVISVGNLTTGGTGKTPFVIRLVKRLLERGRRPAILTRGYAAAAGEPADEVLEFRDALPDVPVVVNPDRVAGAAAAVGKHAADCLVLDDGFQHRRLHRDLDIVLIDALNAWGGGWLLPAGNLREPRRSLQRASLVVITRANQASSHELAALELEIRREVPRTPVLRAGIVPREVRYGGERAESVATLSGAAAFAICGLGNPQSFLRLAESTCGRIADAATFRDHHRYTAADAARLNEAALRAGTMLALTSRKDFVKLRGLWPQPPAVCVALGFLEIEVQLADPNGVLDRQLDRVLASRPHPGNSTS